MNSKKPLETPAVPARKARKDPSSESVKKTGQDRDLFLKSVSAEVRKARERADMTVSDLHRVTGISRTVLQGYEAGRFVPGAMELKKLCQVLNVTPNRVLFGEEKPLETKPLLASFVGDVTKAGGTAKLAIVLQVLSSEELTSLLSLVESIVIARVGGAKKLQELFNVVDVLVGAEDTPGLVASIAEEMFNQMTDEQKTRIGLATQEAFQDLPDTKPRVKPVRPPVKQVGLLESVGKEAVGQLSDDQKGNIVTATEKAFQATPAKKSAKKK